LKFLDFFNDFLCVLEMSWNIIAISLGMKTSYIPGIFNEIFCGHPVLVNVFILLVFFIVSIILFLGVIFIFILYKESY